MKKRILTVFLATLILLCTVFPVYAVQPRWSYTSIVNFYMYFDDEEGSLEGIIEGYSSVTKMEGTITLYKKNILGIWSKTGDTWNVSTSSDTLFIYETFNATSGKQYKAELELEVYSGSNSENITDTATGTCP